jgi:exosome complex RNA-binding protein Rrp4
MVFLRTAVSSAILLSLACAIVVGQDGSVWATKKSGWQMLSSDQRGQVLQFADDFKDYLRTAKSALTSTREVLKRARAAGFADFKQARRLRQGRG